MKDFAYKLLCVLVLLCLVVAGCCARKAQSRAGKDWGRCADRPCFAGLRRGWAVKPGEDLWWALRAKEFAASVPGGRAQPVILQIVSTYDGGRTQFGFGQPVGYSGSTKDMIFGRGRVDLARALATYREAGVKAILQVEPGSADVAACLAVAHAALGKSACVIGYGVDCEWIDARAHKDGRAVTDAEAKAWLSSVLAWSPSATLFLKHWQVSHMPPSYRHERLWFLNDSQKFRNLPALLRDFAAWGSYFKGQTVGFQYGYPSDRNWWRRMKQPTVELTAAVLEKIPDAGFVFWVDFTAEQVTFR
jgi:hypothetical protein